MTFAGSSQALSAEGAPASASEGLVEVRPVREAELPRGPSQAPSVLGGRLVCVTQSPATPHSVSIWLAQRPRGNHISIKHDLPRAQR